MCVSSCHEVAQLEREDTGRWRGDSQEETLILVLNYKQGETDLWLGQNVFYKRDVKKFSFLLHILYSKAVKQN